MDSLLETILRRLPGAGKAPLLSRSEAEAFVSLPSSSTADMLAVAGAVRAMCAPDFFNCGIVNAKSGRCPENCAFCAQSAHHETGSAVYPFVGQETLLQRAAEAASHGTKRFSIVVSGTMLGEADVEPLCRAVESIIRETGMAVCGSLGLLTPERARMYREAGMTRYHHNLETARSFFPHICTTHEYDDDVSSLAAAREAGMEVCSGGIMGLGESRAQRVELACTLAGYRPCHDAPAVIEQVGYDPERDTENPADSVFCAHGAGYNVKWDEVPAHAHVESGVRLNEPEEEEVPAARQPRRQAAPVSSLEEDKQLAAIFERTYGPSKGRELFRPAPVKPAEYHFEPSGPEYLLVDGYNLIFAWDELKKLAADNLEGARQALADLLCNYRGFHDCQVILVFDAYKVPHGTGEVSRYHNIYIVYTREAETADMYIEKTTYQLAKQRRVRVVTSDGAEQLIILGHGALRVSARSFREEVERTNGEIRRILEENRLKNARR